MVGYFVPIGLMGFAPPPVLAYRDNSVVDRTSGTHVHSGLSFGPADPTRALVAIFTGVNGAHGTITSVTIGGVPASLVIRQQDTAGQNAAYTYIARVPTGTSGDVVLSGVPSDTNWASCCAIYSVTNLLSLTATDTNGHAVNSGGSVSTSVGVQSQGIVIANAYCTVICSGSSMSGVTRNFFTVIGPSPNQAEAGGSFTATSAQTLTTSVTFTGGTGFFNPIITAASFR